MTGGRDRPWRVALVVGLLAAGSGPAGAQAARCATVLLLDLDADGLFLSDRDYPVAIDLDRDGRRENVQWTASGHDEGLLWWDRDGDREVDGGDELFVGRAGTPGGFAGLNRLDQPAEGGDGDGRLTATDEVWGELRLWIDRNHDGEVGRRESSPLGDWGVVSLELRSADEHRLDGSLNLYTGLSTFRREDRPDGPFAEVALRCLE